MRHPPAVADHPTMGWWYLTEGRPTGPVDDDMIRTMAGRGELSSGSLVYRDEAATWADLAAFEAHLGLTRHPAGHYVIPVVDSSDEFPLGAPAGCWRRIGARMVDNLVLRLIGTVAGILIIPWAVRGGENRVMVASILLSTLLVAAYETILVAVRGQTVGKSRLGIEVVDARTGALLTLPRALLRSVLAAVAFPISAITIFLPGNPTVHDRIVGSRVQRVG